MYRRFAFTLFNFSEQNKEKIKQLSDHFIYAVVGEETCPSTGRKHLQGFIHLKNPWRFGRIKKELGNDIHIEPAFGTDEQNRQYCIKEGNYFEIGEIKQQNAKRIKHEYNVDEVAEDIIRGVPLKEVITKYPGSFLKWGHNMAKLDYLFNQPKSRDFKTEVYYYYGEPGVGKSRRAKEEAESTNEDIYYKSRGQWWDFYDNQENVIIDDFYGWIPYDEMLKICDRYPYQVPIKGGYKVFNSKRIWITSNKPLEEIYKFNGFDPTALRRRMTRIEHMH